MSKVKISSLTAIPEVKGVMACDLEGALTESTPDLDGETIAAVTGFVAKSMVQAGEMLGVGVLQRMTVTSKNKAAVIIAISDGLLTVYVDPTKPLAAIEKKLDAALPR